MRSIILRSPAKINLYLKVINRRPDGYHNLKTIFERISLCDEIKLTSNRDGCIRIECNHPQVPLNSKNLVYRVAALLQKRFNIKAGVDIQIQKRIPVAAGLAGGSSNAATTLLGLNKIWKLGLKQHQLAQIASEIGSDVAFFVYGSSWAVGTGRGEVIRTQKIPIRLWHILVVPRRRMLTPKVYGALNLKLTKTSDNVNILLRSLKKYNIKKAKQLLANDLEASILKLCPSLLRVKRRMENLLGEGVCFSGSGPSVFGVTDSREDAERAKKILSRRYRQVFIVSTL